MNTLSNKQMNKIKDFIIHEICVYKNLDESEIQDFINEKLNQPISKRICIGKIQNGQPCRNEAKFLENHIIDKQNGLYCSHHVPRTPPPPISICKGSITSRNCRCTNIVKNGEEYCGKHKWISVYEDDTKRFENRMCIHFIHKGGELKQCGQLARPSGYTCEKHMTSEVDLINQLNFVDFFELKSDLNVFKKDENYSSIIWPT